MWILNPQVNGYDGSGCSIKLSAVKILCFMRSSNRKKIADRRSAHKARKVGRAQGVLWFTCQRRYARNVLRCLMIDDVIRIDVRGMREQATARQALAASRHANSIWIIPYVTTCPHPRQLCSLLTLMMPAIQSADEVLYTYAYEGELLVPLGRVWSDLLTTY